MDKEYFKDKKTINVDKEIWEKLHNIRTKKGYRRVNEVIKDFLEGERE